jgi:hypothetical protein
VMCCSLWFLSLRLSKSIFQQSTQFLPMKAGIEWCAALCDFLFGLKSIFQQSYPILTYESRDWVMCCSFVPFFTFGLRVFFNSPTQFLPMSRDWVMCCLCDFFHYVWS